MSYQSPSCKLQATDLNNPPFGPFVDRFPRKLKRFKPHLSVRFPACWIPLTQACAVEGLNIDSRGSEHSVIWAHMSGKSRKPAEIHSEFHTTHGQSEISISLTRSKFILTAKLLVYCISCPQQHWDRLTITIERYCYALVWWAFLSAKNSMPRSYETCCHQVPLQTWIGCPENPGDVLRTSFPRRQPPKLGCFSHLNYPTSNNSADVLYNVSSL